jgi:hypothetical protein
MSGLLSYLGFKDEPEIEEANKQCDVLLKTAKARVKERQEAEAAAKAQPQAQAQPQPAVAAPAAGGGRRRKTAKRKSPSKKGARKSIYNKISKWNPFK